MNPTLFALTGFLAWSLALLVLMELIRCKLVLTREVPANGFTPDNARLSHFMQRLARAHANCIEGLPIFGGLMLVAIATGQAAITDPLAYVLLATFILPLMTVGVWKLWRADEPSQNSPAEVRE